MRRIHFVSTLGWWLLVSAPHTIVLGQNTTIFVQRNETLPCLALFEHGRALPRCNSHNLHQPLGKHKVSARCPSGGVTINFVPAEIKPGFRLVGSQSGDKYSCYPLSDQDFWRSREAVLTLGLSF
jgi:hypothetical protein